MQATRFPGWDHIRGHNLTTPPWLANLAQDAKVEDFASRELKQFVAPKPGHKSARDIIDAMTGMHHD